MQFYVSSLLYFSFKFNRNVPQYTYIRISALFQPY